MTDDTERIRSVASLPRRDSDAPAAARHETESSLLERVAGRLGDVVVEHARAGRAIPWAIVVALAVLVAGALGWRYAEAGDDCDPLVVQYVLGQAEIGEREAVTLDLAGHRASAAAVRALTSINGQPDDVRLCALLIGRKKQ